MMLQGKSLLAGRTGATGGAVFRAINPATSEPLAPAFSRGLARRGRRRAASLRGGLR
jgi:hypothetical protein